MATRKISSVLREMQSAENFCVEFDSALTSVTLHVRGIGALRKGKSGPRYVAEGSRVVALDVPAKQIRHYGTQLITLAQSVGVRIRYRKYMLPLRYADKKDLDEFLDNRESTTFVVSDKMTQGIRMCLDNAISLASTSDSLVTIRPSYAVFLMYTALEELGKAALLVDALRLSPVGSEFTKVNGFRHHTTKLLRAVEGLAGEVVRTGRNSTEIRDGALRALNQVAKSRFGENGAIAFRFLFRKLAVNFQFLRDMGEFFRESGIYVEYEDVNKSWRSPWTRFSEQEIKDLNETVSEYCREYATKIGPPVTSIPKLEQILPTRWFDRLAARWPPKK